MRFLLLFITLSCVRLAYAIDLGEAPQRFEPQDNTWRESRIPKAAKTRADVVALYRSTFLPASSVALAWSGSVSACDPGTTNVDHQQAVIARVNYYRALVDLPPVTLLTATEAAQEQAAALMMSANNALSHTPPGSWVCYSAAGASAAGNSNSVLGA